MCLIAVRCGYSATRRHFLFPWGNWGLQGGLTEVGEWPTISFLLLSSYLKKADVYQNQQPVPSSVINDIVKITLKENF